MKTLSIDIETYSSVDLAKCGVYKYTEAPDFDILLFGYSVDGSPVQVVDLACGETIPAEIIAALTDTGVTKWAFNAQFERICLSRWLRKNGNFDNTGYSIPEDTVGNYLNPASWKCTMIWSAYMGLPLSLDGVGAVLGLGKQKMTEGKELIKYFCQPCASTKTNGGRTRNLPENAPDKWDSFKRYNIRDVEVEMSIQEKLAKFPVPEAIWNQYHLDQKINGRGVALDMELVHQAIAMDIRSRKELTDAMKKLTALDMLELCRNYDQCVETIYPDRKYFFPSPSVRGDGMYSMEWIIPTFRRFLQTAGISGYGEIRPRLYDLRHTFATHRLYQWVKEGKDINACLAYLSEYMGHSNLESTAYYIHLLPTLYTDLPELHLDSSFEMEADLCD